MRKYLMGATLVKGLSVGMMAYKSLLLSIKDQFLVGPNVSLDVIRFMEREGQLIDKWLSTFRPGHEFAYTEIEKEDREFLRYVATITLSMSESIIQRFKAHFPESQIKQLEDLRRVMKESLEGVHLEIER